MTSDHTVFPLPSPVSFLFVGVFVSAMEYAMGVPEGELGPVTSTVVQAEKMIANSSTPAFFAPGCRFRPGHFFMRLLSSAEPAQADSPHFAHCARQVATQGSEEW